MAPLRLLPICFALPPPCLRLLLSRHRDDLGNRRRPIPSAICHDGHVPLPVRAANPRAGVYPGDHGVGVCDHRQTGVPGHGQVLGQAVRHQLCPGRDHRPDHGVPVRHQLGLLQPLCRRHLRRAIGHRRADGVLPRVDLYRPVLLRLGSPHQGVTPGRDLGFARRSFAIASAFGMASILSVIIVGDESGYEIGDVQKTKLAAIEAEWETEEAPAAFTLFGLLNQEAQRTDYAVKIPYAMGIIATRSLDQEVTGIKDLIKQHELRIRNGMIAYGLLEKLRAGDKSEANIAAFNAVKQDLGYGLLLKKYTPAAVDASEEQIRLASLDTIPHVATMFWTFRAMVASGFLMLLLFALAAWASVKRNAENKPWLLKFALLSLPLPWIAAQTGWIVAEHGRQPWSIAEVLPVHLSASSISAADVWGSLAALITFYSLLLVVEMYLMIKFARLGPSSLHTGRYHFERGTSAQAVSA